MSSAGDGRKTAAYQTLQRIVCRPQPGVGRCWLCGDLIDYAAPPRSRLRPSLDHVTAIANGGSLLDPANARLAHLGCNAAKGARQTRQGVSNPSREW